MLSRPPIPRRPVARIGIMLPGLLGISLSCAMCAGTAVTEELKNLSYHGIYDRAVTLKGGVYEGEPFMPGGASRPRVELAEAPSAVGDLDEDGAADIAVFLTETSGGTGVNTYLAAVSRREGEPHNVATLLIGDRVRIRSLVVQQGALVLELLTHSPREPACCPTLMVRKTFRLQDGNLVETSSKQLGHLSLTHLKGVTWTLIHLARGEEIPEDVRITAVFQTGRVFGGAGCNRYFANVTGKGLGNLDVGLVASTKMACPPRVMQIEDRYLRALERVHRFSFVLGQLALAYEEKGTPDMMFFRPSP